MILIFLTISCGGISSNSSRYPAARSELGSACAQSLKNLLDKSRSKFKSRYLKFLSEILSEQSPNKLQKFSGRIKLLQNPRISFASKILAMRQAKNSISMSTYIFKSDDTGYFLLNELKNAMDRGVKVRLMVDSVGSIKSGPFHHELKTLMEYDGGRELVEIVIFNAINPAFQLRKRLRHIKNIFQQFFTPENEIEQDKLMKLDRRIHDKLLLVDHESNDNAIIFFGGRNVANPDSHITPDEESFYQDLDVMVKNLQSKEDLESNTSFSEAVKSYFDILFYNTEHLKIQDSLFPLRDKIYQRELVRMNEAAERQNEKLESLISMLKRENHLDTDFENSQVSLLNEIININRTNPVLSPYRNILKIRKLLINSISRRVYTQMRRAKKSIKMISPYLHLTNREIRFLKQWLREDRSRKLEIVTNSILTNDVLLSQAHFDHYLARKLMKDIDLRDQIIIHQYGRINSKKLSGDREYHVLHAKFYIFDDESAIVGSSNLDSRSRFFNSETGVEIIPVGQDSLNQLKAIFKSLVRNSHLWGSPEWEEIHGHQNIRQAKSIQLIISKLLHILVYTLPNYSK